MVRIDGDDPCGQVFGLGVPALAGHQQEGLAQQLGVVRIAFQSGQHVVGGDGEIVMAGGAQARQIGRQGRVDLRRLPGVGQLPAARITRGLGHASRRDQAEPGENDPQC